jgi:GNAT superfamily N-acetyltransferase
MSFRLATAQPKDAAAIAEIHMGVFGTNALIRAIYPTEEVREGLAKAVEMKALADIQDPHITVLVAHYHEHAGTAVDHACPPTSSPIIGFAKWVHPVRPEDEYTPPPWSLPEGTDWAILTPWIAAAEKTEEAVMGKTPHYGEWVAHLNVDQLTDNTELTYLAVDAQYARRGVGAMLLQWGLDQCDETGCPAYVESTTEAVTFYKEHGFESGERITIELRGRVDDDDVVLYEEVGCIYKSKRIGIV